MRKNPPKRTWTVQTDGSATKKAGGAGVVLISPVGEILKYAVRLQFLEKNNEAEYEVLLTDRKSTRLNSSHAIPSRMPSSA